MRMKKMAAAVVAMVTALALTACAGGFDASKYVQGVQMCIRDRGSCGKYR